jgi:hypothetical protein
MIFSNISHHLSDPAPAEECRLTGDRRLEELYRRCCAAQVVMGQRRQHDRELVGQRADQRHQQRYRRPTRRRCVLKLSWTTPVTWVYGKFQRVFAGIRRPPVDGSR